MERFLWVCLAGAAGTGARYLVGVWAAERFGSSFPYGTLIVNVAGCFLMALVMHLALTTAAFPPNVRFALATGFIGGLTTYSSFNYETTKLLRDGAWTAASLNFCLTTVGCFTAGVFGLLLAKRLFVG
jgi:fluoride exporter